MTITPRFETEYNMFPVQEIVARECVACNVPADLLSEGNQALLTQSHKVPVGSV